MRRFPAYLGRTIAVLTGMIVQSPAVGAQELSYSGWAQYSTGRYQFPTRTSSFYFANGLTIVAGRLRASASIPFIVQDAGWTQYSGSGIVPTGGMPGHDSATGGMAGGMNGRMMSGGSSMVSTHMGFGDPLGRADLLLYRSAGSLASLAVTAAVKPPLATVSSGFGTGRWDYAGGATLTSTLRELLVVADAAYWVLGDTPALPFRNPLAYAISVGRLNRGGGFGLLASVSGTSSILTGVPGSVSVGGGATYRVSPAGLLSANVTIGATRSAPAITVGIGWQRRLD